MQMVFLSPPSAPFYDPVTFTLLFLSCSLFFPSHRTVWCHVSVPPPSHGTITNQPKCCPPTEPLNSRTLPQAPDLSPRHYLPSDTFHRHHRCASVCVCMCETTESLTPCSCAGVSIYVWECEPLYMCVSEWRSFSQRSEVTYTDDSFYMIEWKKSLQPT